MRIDGTESECPRCHKKFEVGFKFECPFCGGLIPKGSERCPTCLIDLGSFGGQDRETVEKKTDSILDELIQLESSLIKQEEKRFCCPECSWLLSGTESKCPKCGRPLVNGDGPVCPICMAPISKDATECARCGATLKIVREPEPAAPAPPVPVVPSPAPGPVPFTAEQPKQVRPDLGDIDRLLTCPHCGAAAKMEATSCPTCGKGLVQRKEPVQEPEESPTDAAATEALQTLKEIEKQALGPRTRKLRDGKVTSVAPRAQGAGNGFSNGLGQTNGTSMVNGRSKTNGIGRVNGKVNGRTNGRVNGTGAVNGRSLVNGKGMSSGLRAKATAYTGRRERFVLKWQFIAVLVAVVVIVPTVIYFAYPGKSEPISVDGDFSDWDEAPRFGARTLSGSSSIDITEWAVLESGSSVYFYARTEGTPMASEEAESFFLFIDSDASASTGYIADGIGAEYLLRFNGWNGSVQSAALDERIAGADQYDWNSWQDAGIGVARVEGNEVEAKGVLPAALSESARFVLMAKDSEQRTSVSYAAPSEGGLLVVTLEPLAEVEDGIIPAAASVTLMNARFSCQGASGSVTGVTPSTSGADLVSQIQGFELSPDQDHVVPISVNSINAAPEQLVTVNILASQVSSSFAAVQVVGQQVSAYISSAPVEVMIDGAFGDWVGRTTLDEDYSHPQNANLDIESTGNYSTSESAFFYVSVSGELCRGCPIPTLVKKPSGAGGGNHGVPVRMTGEDILRVYLDSDGLPSTGLGVAYDSKVIGADRMVEVAGINGEITSATSWNYSGGRWIQSSVTVTSEKDYSQIELGFNSLLIGGQQEVDFIIEMTCWSDEFDRACYNPAGTRALTARIAGNAHIETVASGISNSPWATSMSYQRKLFWDGTNYWSFYFDGTDTVVKYSASGGATWTSQGSVFTTSGVNETSIWYDSANNVVYAVGDTSTASTSIRIQKGSVSPAAHTITWAASDSTLTTSTIALAGKNTFISRDANGYIWVVSSNCTQTTPTRYQLTAFKSVSTNSISSWAYSGQMLANAGTDGNLKGSVVPAGTGSNMWGIYASAGSVASRKYTGTWQTPQTTIFAAGGQGINTEIAPPSVVVDNVGVVHVIYGTGRKVGSVTMPSIEYSHNDTGATTFTTSVDIDPSLPSDVGDIYPTLSLDTTTNHLYAFWLRTDTSGVGVSVYARKCVGGTWSDISVGSQSSYPKQYLTSIYSVAGNSYICWEWTQNTTATIHVMFDKIPEFESVLLPMSVAIILCVAINSRQRRKGGS